MRAAPRKTRARPGDSRIRQASPTACPKALQNSPNGTGGRLCPRARDRLPTGRRPGRPRLVDRPGFGERWRAIYPEIASGRLSHGGAARALQIGYASLLRLLRAEEAKGESPP